MGTRRRCRGGCSRALAPPATRSSCAARNRCCTGRRSPSRPRRGSPECRPRTASAVFDLLVLAGAVEAHLFGQLYVTAQIFIRGDGQDAFGEIALVEDEPLVEGTVVQEDLAILHLDLAHPEVALHAVEDLAVRIEQLEPQVVEGGMLGAPQGRTWPVGQVRRVRGFTATEEGQTPFDEGGTHANGIFEHLLAVEFHRRAEAHLPFYSFDRDLHIDAGGVNVRGKPEGVDSAAVYRLEPDSLPDPRRPGVEDPLCLLFPVLLASGDGHVSAGVFGPHYQDVLSGREGVRHVGGERRVTALVRGYPPSVPPDRRAVIHGAEVEQETLVTQRRVIEGACVPDDVVEGSLPDSGVLRLVAERDDYLAVEGRTVRTQLLRGDTLPAIGESGVRIVEGEGLLAVQVRPALPAELRARVLGSWNRDQGAVPFLLETLAIRSEDRGRRSAG